MDIETIREFLGWCTVINFGVMIISLLILLMIRDWASNFHAKMFGLDQAFVKQAYFQYLANYKIAVIAFNLVPYIALRIMGSS